MPTGHPAVPVIPATMADITAPWLSEVLGQPIERLTVVPLTGSEAGFLGDVARIHPEPPVEGTASLIVKLPPSDPGGRQVGAMLNVWAREQAFYREVAPASPGVRVPRCHLAAGDQGTDRWVLVLEDCPSDPLVPARGATRPQAEAAVDALAGFHATWWQADERFGWMPGLDTSDFGGLAPAWTAAIPRFLDRYGHLLPDGTARWLGHAPDWLYGWAARAATEPLTIVHADYRLDNLRHHDGVMTMIDWQTALRGPGPMDLASFVATACTVADRRRWETELLDRYEAGLRAGGVGVDRGWLDRSYDENLVWWMGQFANNLAHLEPDDPEAQAALDTTIERVFAAAADRDVGRLLDS